MDEKETLEQRQKRLASLPEAPPKWICEDCEMICTTPLEAKNPFDDSEMLHGCPHCKAANTLIMACQFEGCEQRASSGNPGVYGYRYIHLCWDHSHRNPKNAQ